jgi:hypothetical protein
VFSHIFNFRLAPNICKFGYRVHDGTEMGTNNSEEHIASVFFPEDGGGMYAQVYGYWQRAQCHKPEE